MTDLDAALSELKRRGSATLVVGSIPHDAYVRVSRRMLGTDAAARRRLLVVPESDCEAAVDRLRNAGSTDPERAQVVACDGTSRSAAAGAACDAGSPRVRRVDGSLDELGAAITAWIDHLEARAGGFSPAELRVGVDPVPPLKCGSSRTFGFLHVLAEQVRRLDGMAHVRVPRDRTDEAVLTLEPLFDAVLELRLDGYRLEQRWHLPDHGVVSDWMALPDRADGG
ncbi:MAG: hypothetical protein ABEJ34_04430 [Haloferacaceae archaeon]